MPKKSNGPRKRRGHGEGSIDQLPSGQWRARVSLGNDPVTGKPVRITVTGESYQEVLTKSREAREAAAAKAVVPAGFEGPPTLGEWLDRWLEETRKSLADASILEYARGIGYIKPVSGHEPLATFGVEAVHRMYRLFEEDGLTSSSAARAGRLLRRALKAAVFRRLVPVNAAAQVPLPKARKRETRVWSVEELRTFLTANVNSRYYPLYVMALDTGLRQGELFALTWADLDRESGAVWVSRSLTEIKGILSVKDVKTRASRRRVPLSPQTIEALADHRKRLKRSGPADLVFPNVHGNWLRCSTFREKQFLPAIARAKVPVIRFHDLRHTCATQLLLAGANVKSVSERLGHSSIQITLATYAHCLPDTQTATTQLASQVLGKR